MATVGELQAQLSAALQAGDYSLVAQTQDLLKAASTVPVATGTATLVAGTVTVSDTAITAASEIRLRCATLGGTPGALYVSAKSAGVSFSITSTSGTDTTVVAYDIVRY